ncbi:MAG: hypothetical protein AVDCRST_MAG62-1342 [uncultured Sphingomonas sp.]|uniref:Ice-binding protein C-terminal domain-containing protein n=1 Tax=uncultured Sphingomonas sp. TaxID=158754 RepID=A0A6J4TKU0_9SPHN|nr:MAG: hypothetical protein AVDCRST_MAG62-1342 [uncultured Sphingomonas sp.]
MQMGWPVLKQRYNRRAFSAGACLLLAAAAGVPLGMSTMGVDMGGPMVESAQRVMAMLDARSPGERTKAELTKAKAARRKLALAAAPRQRALGKIIQPKAAVAKPFVDALTAAPVAAVAPVLSSVAPLAQVLAPPAASPIAIGGLIIAPPAGGGGGGGGGGGVLPGNPVTPPNQVPAVPEPSTWLMMLLGFGTVGWAIRRRNGTRGADLRAA